MSSSSTAAAADADAVADAVAAVERKQEQKTEEQEAQEANPQARALPFATSWTRARLTPHCERVLWRRGVPLRFDDSDADENRRRAHDALRAEAVSLMYMRHGLKCNARGACDVESSPRHDHRACASLRKLMLHAQTCENRLCFSACLRARLSLSDFGHCPQRDACYVCLLVDDARKAARLRERERELARQLEQQQTLEHARLLAGLSDA